MVQDLPFLASKTYTKEELCLFEPTPDPCAIVIFGASGDLAHRKLLPSLYHLLTHGLLPKDFFVIGVSRTSLTDQAFRNTIKKAVAAIPDQSKVSYFLERCYYMVGDYATATTYQSLKKKISDLGKNYGIDDRVLYYLATPPSVYSAVVHQLGASGLVKPTSDSKGWVRVVVEKPFGRSFASANSLNQDILKVLTEDQIYRIDHYLGKETVQNILMFRFANILFEPVWNRGYISNIRITASEQIGVEHRAGYYEQAGIWRDMFQNHLLQLLALIAMEPPSSLVADVVRDRRSEVFKAVHPISLLSVPDVSLVGQYGGGSVAGKSVPSYREEEGVNPASKIPTFAALKLGIDNWRWQGVPFYLRSGKRLNEREISITIQFKSVPTSIFKPLTPDQLTPNQLVFRIQPDEGITMRFEAKKTGPKLCIATVHMDFGFEETFKTPQPESYARLFLDAMKGDQTLFARSDEVLESWKIMDPILNYWESAEAPGPVIYPAGSAGPSACDGLLSKDRFSWIS